VDQDRGEAPYQNRQTLEEERGLARVTGNSAYTYAADLTQKKSKLDELMYKGS